MNSIKKTLIFILALFMFSGIVYAEDTKTYSYKATLNLDTGDVTMEEDSLIGESDYSSLMVKVTKTTAEGITTEVYTGPLSGYDDGNWSNVDFSDIQALLIFDWETEDSICISPIAESNTETQYNSISLLSDEENLMPLSSDLIVTSQIKLNGITVNEQGMRIIDDANMSCTLSVSNASTTSNGVTAILATYTSAGRLYNIKTFEIDVEAGQTKNMEIVYQFDAENESTGKLMLWNSFSNLIPIRATIDFSQTSGINAYYYNSDNRLLQVDKMNGTSLLFTYDNMGNLLSRTIRK